MISMAICCITWWWNLIDLQLLSMLLKQGVLAVFFSEYKCWIPSHNVQNAQNVWNVSECNFDISFVTMLELCEISESLVSAAVNRCWACLFLFMCSTLQSGLENQWPLWSVNFISLVTCVGLPAGATNSPPHVLYMGISYITSLLTGHSTLPYQSAHHL